MIRINYKKLGEKLGKKNANLCFQVCNNLIVSFLKLIPLFSGIVKACISSSQGYINLHHMYYC